MMNTVKNGRYIVGGVERWYKNDKFHREEIDSKTGLSLPAVMYKDGAIGWYKEGVLHREEIDPKTGLSLPAIIETDGAKQWYKEGVLHREEINPKTGLSLPAEIWADGTMQWYKEGDLHRIDGPAVVQICDNVKIIEKWFLDGIEVENEDHPWYKAQKEKKALSLIINNHILNDEDDEVPTAVPVGGDMIPTEQVIQSGRIDGKSPVGGNMKPTEQVIQSGRIDGKSPVGGDVNKNKTVLRI